VSEAACRHVSRQDGGGWRRVGVVSAIIS
jgi:hypothetical protein